MSPGPPTGAGVVFTITGDTFRPTIELTPGSSAEVVWLDEQGSALARGTDPLISFGSAATHTVTMLTTFDQVITLNLGFNSGDDEGRYSLEKAYNKDPEAVSAIANLTLLTSLRRFLAARGQLGGTLDLTGLAQLEHVECFKARVETVILPGCESLIRLCLEQCNLRSLDLNPVAASLRDLRAAAQQSGSLELAPLEQPLPQLYHFCVRDQTVVGHPTSEQLPACEELWNWGCAQVGTLPTPGRAHSVLAAWNAYTKADFSGQWQDAEVAGSLDLSDNQLDHINISGCRALRVIRLGRNTLGGSEVDAVLAEVQSWGTNDGELVLDGSNASPSSTGHRSADALRGSGWMVALASK